MNAKLQQKTMLPTTLSTCLMLFFSFFLNSALAAQNSTFTPFSVSNTLPISQGLGLPNTLSSHSLSVGEKALNLNIGIQSNANDAGSMGGERLTLDGESQYLGIGFRYGLSELWQIDTQFSYLHHSSGSFDSIIQSWHELFGLDDGDRPLFPNDDFLYAYSSDNQDRAISESVSGISDMRVGLGYLVKQKWLDQLMLRVGLTLPTGNSEKLTGSDKIDADLGLYVAGRGEGFWENIAWHANVGYIFIGDDQAFGIQTKNSTWFNSLGLYWGFNPAFTVKAQLDSHGGMFESDIDELYKVATQLTLGLAYQAKKKNIIEIYFSEDVAVNRSADFSVGIQYQTKF